MQKLNKIKSLGNLCKLAFKQQEYELNHLLLIHVIAHKMQIIGSHHGVKLEFKTPQFVWVPFLSKGP